MSRTIILITGGGNDSNQLLNEIQAVPGLGLQLPALLSVDRLYPFTAHGKINGEIVMSVLRLPGPPLVAPLLHAIIAKKTPVRALRKLL